MRRRRSGPRERPFIFLFQIAHRRKMVIRIEQRNRLKGRLQPLKHINHSTAFCLIRITFQRRVESAQYGRTQSTQTRHRLELGAEHHLSMKGSRCRNRRQDRRATHRKPPHWSKTAQPNLQRASQHTTVDLTLERKLQIRSRHSEFYKTPSRCAPFIRGFTRMGGFRSAEGRSEAAGAATNLPSSPPPKT